MSIYCFTPNVHDHGVDLPIQRTMEFIFVLSNLVTHDHMCTKFRWI